MDTSAISEDDRDALAWLASQPGGAVKASAAEFGRNVGWNRQKAGRRLDAWTEAGIVVRKGGVITLNKERTVVRTQVVREAGQRWDRADNPPDGHRPDAGQKPRTIERTVREEVSMASAQTPGLSADDLPPLEASEYPPQPVMSAVSEGVVAERPQASVPAEQVTYAHAVPGVRQHGPADGLDWMARLVAVGMAVVTAYFSINGLLTLFPGDYAGVAIFGIGVECLKVVGVMYLSAHWHTIAKLWRFLAVVAVIIAASLNSASIYAKFASLHASSPAAAAATREASAAELDARIEAAQVRLDDLKRRSSAIDTTVESIGKRSTSKGANRTITNTRTDRAGLSNDSEAAAKELAGLKAERGRVTADGHRASAEELPVTLMASLFSTDAATVLRWLVCAVVICGDPAALVLLAAVGSRAKRQGRA